MALARPENVPGIIDRRLGELGNSIKKLEWQIEKETPTLKLGYQAIREIQSQLSSLSQHAEHATASQRRTCEALMERYRVAVASFQQNPLERIQELVT